MEVVAVFAVRRMVVASFSTVLTLGLLGVLTVQVQSDASATTPSWNTTAAYTPLPNVRAVSCAVSETVCVAVGDDGGNYASILVSNDGGSTWAEGSVPNGVASLATVSCPTA